jgi:hypothetical protein
LNGIVVDYECKHDGVPLVAPETGSGGCLVVVEFGKAVSEEVVSKDACLAETVHARAHFKVDPGVMGKLVELVLVNEFLGDVSKLDADVLWLVEQGVEIEVLEVNGGKPSVTLGENMLMSNLTSSIEPWGGTYNSRIWDVVAANGNACTVSVISLLSSDLANNLGVGDFPAAVGWDLVVRNAEKGVDAFDALALIGDALA